MASSPSLPMLSERAQGIRCFANRLRHSLISYAQSHSLLSHICYFITISLAGLLALKSLPLRTSHDNKPAAFDLFFTSVSAATVSSMATVEMESFSNAQLVVLTVLMLIGGEVMTSTLSLHLCNKSMPSKQRRSRDRELVQIQVHPDDRSLDVQLPTGAAAAESMRRRARRSLVGVLKGYLLFMHVAGSIAIVAYMSLVDSAREVLERKGIKISTFSVFTTVSSFSSCGFMPNNENMVVFKSNLGLLLLVVPQVLLGNTLFPSCLRFCIWVLGWLSGREEYGYLLRNWKETGFFHLLPYRHSLFLLFTVAGFVAVQTVAVCCMEWRSPAFAGMDSYQKLVGAFFLSVNARHTGESVVDLSALSQAILVMFVVMMYLPPYTTFLPIEDESSNSIIDTEDIRRPTLLRSLVMSQLSYLTIFIICICITERDKLTEDPLNFNVLNIVVEVISAYGNVGFSTGYSCKRQLKPDGICQDKWYGFAGKWSTKGKIVLIIVMFFGRLKKFNMSGGRSWKLT